MGKNRIIKIIIVIILPLIFLTGCLKWDDVKEAVGEENIKNGVSCVYNYTDTKFNGIEKVTFSVDSNGLYIAFNSDEKSFLAGPSSKNYYDSKSFNGIEYKISSSFAEDYIDLYKKNGGCPKTIYIDENLKQGKHNFNVRKVHSAGDPIKDYAYTTASTTISGEGGNCYYNQASTCNNFQYSGDTLVGNIFIEYGYQKNGEKYLYIAKNQYFTGAITLIKEKNGKFSDFDVENPYLKYEIPSDRVNNIWLGDNKVLSRDEMGAVLEKNNPEWPILYIFDKKNPVHVITSSDGEMKTIEGEKIGSSSTTVNIDTNIPEHSCTSLLGDPTMSKPPSPAFLLTYAFKIVRYVALILLVVLSIMDFVESVSSQDQDSINKAINKTIKRAIICIIIFLLPLIIEFVLSFLNDRAVNICINT